MTDDLRAWTRENTPGVDCVLETDKFRDHTFASARTDWLGAWRNWMRKAQESRGPPRAAPQQYPTAAERRNATLDQLTGRNRNAPERRTDASIPAADVVDIKSRIVG